MGKYFIDQYSLLHLSTGVIAYFWNIPLCIWIVLNILFEYIENTQVAFKFIDKYLSFWPGGKQSPDTILNIIGDIIFGIIGWILSYKLDVYMTTNKWNTREKL
jgi:hypothetical protein